MTKESLKPWTFAPVVTAFFVLFVLFNGGMGVLTFVALPSLKVTLVTKVLIVVLILSGVGGTVSLFMWRRYWRQVQWESTFWAFVSGPPPQYEEALLAWRWGRRSRMCWILTMATIGAIVATEGLAGNW